MRRRSFLKKAGLGIAGGAAATALAACGRKEAATSAAVTGSAQPEIQWRMASSFPKNLDTLYNAAELMAKRIAEGTDAKFRIRVFAGGEIVPGLQVLDAVQNGTVECGHTAPYYYIGKDPAFAFATALPFGLNARQQNAWMYYGGGLEAVAALFREYGCVQFPSGNTGVQMGGWYRKEIKSLADLKGLKMRVSGLAGQVLAKLGVVGQQIAGGEIYQALERGTIDAAEWVGPYDDEKLGFQKVAKHYYYPGWWEGGPQLSTLVNLKQWQSLPKAYQSVFEAACAEANVRMLADYDAKNPAALKKLVGAGAVLKPFPKDVMLAAQKAAFEIYDEAAAKSTHFKRIYGDWLKFRNDQFLWFRVAEMGYDNFVFTNAARPAVPN